MMMKKWLVFGFLMLFSVSLVVAIKPNFIDMDIGSSNGHANVAIPEDAIEVASGVFYLGESLDEKGRLVEGYAFLLRGNYAKPGVTCGNGVCDAGENARKCAEDCSGGSEEPVSSCYTFIDSSGAKWNNQEPYLVDPRNSHGLTDEFVRQNIADALVEWEAESGEDNFGDEVFGTVNASSIGNTANGKNEVVFGSISGSGTIAVTYVWGIFRGNPHNRQLTEWDMVFDDVDFSWANDGSAGSMDFENIAQHELGHALGLSHPESSCKEETMYAYANIGEIKKRDLFDGDKAGIFDLYN